MSSEYGTKVRLLRIMIALINQPGFYTKRKLAELYGVSIDTIKHDFNALNNAGFLLEYDHRHRYSFVQEKPFLQLQDLLHFSAEDQVLLYQAIDQIIPNDQKRVRLKQKLAALYDYRKLGFAYLSRPHLEKIDQLLYAQAQKKQVLLRDYHSSHSNDIQDRWVEAFHIQAADNTFQAYDLRKKEIRHFKISRVSALEISDRNWEFEGYHQLLQTDPFRVADPNQVEVELIMALAARNTLIEQYPLSRNFVETNPDGITFTFRCLMNHRFLGLDRFILAQHKHILAINHPDSLRRHLNQLVAEFPKF
jgi:predicted DNA-binding transcriptional regulator YafY